MAENAIDKVRQAEAKADETLREAAQQAAQKVEAARLEAARLAAKAEEDAKAQAARQVGEAQENGRRALETAAAALESEMDALREKARTAQAGAVEKILAALA